MKTVWMVSGNKGGVGKSLFCLALASALQMRKEDFAVLDGDKRTGDVHASFLRKFPTLDADFRNLNPASHQDLYDARYEAKITQLLKASKHLVINTPDGADHTLMKWFDVTLQHTETNNCLFKFIYLMSDRSDGLKMLPELIKRFSYFYPIRNLHFGPSELFGEFNREYAPLFREIFEFPKLRGEELRMLFNLKTYPAEAIQLIDQKTNALTIPTLSRVRLTNWQLQIMDEFLDNLIDNKTDPNIRTNT